MGLPTPTSTPRIFLPIPGDDESNIEGGMIGIKTADNDGEIWSRPISTALVPSPAPEQVAKISDVAASEASLQIQIDSISVSSTDYFSGLGTPSSPLNLAATKAMLTTDSVALTDGVLSRTEKYAIGFRKSELLRTYLNPSSGFNRGTILYNGFLFCNDSASDTLYKIDAVTEDIVQSHIPSSIFGNKSISRVDNILYWAVNTTIYTVDTDDIRVTTETAIDISIGSVSVGLSMVSDVLGYAINATNQVYKLEKTGGGGTTWTATLLSPAGITLAADIASSSGFYYISDDVGATTVMRAYNASTGVLVGSSTAISGNSLGSGIDNGVVWSVIGSNVCAFRLSDASLLYQESGVTTVGTLFDFSCGKICGQLDVSPYTICVYSQPSLTLETPARTRLHDVEITSTCSDLAGVTHFGDDVMRTVIDNHANSTSIKRLNTAVGGISVVSVVASAPASPTEGDWYLLESGELINYIDGAWATYDPYEGAVVRNLDTGRPLKYDGSDWVDALRPTTRTPEFTYPVPGTVIFGVDALPSDEGNIINIPGPCGFAPPHLFFPSNVTSITNFSCFVSVEPDVTEGCDIGIDSVLEVETDLAANASAWNLPCDTNHLQTTIYRVWVLNGGLSVQSMTAALV